MPTKIDLPAYWRDTFAVINARITNKRVAKAFGVRMEIVTRWPRENADFNQQFERLLPLDRVCHDTPLMDRVDDLIASHAGEKFLAIRVCDLVRILKEVRSLHREQLRQTRLLMSEINRLKHLRNARRFPTLHNSHDAARGDFSDEPGFAK